MAEYARTWPGWYVRASRARRKRRRRRALSGSPSGNHRHLVSTSFALPFPVSMISAADHALLRSSLTSECPGPANLYNHGLLIRVRNVRLDEFNNYAVRI